MPFKEPNKDIRGVKEAIAIRRADAAMNRDTGRHDLPRGYNDLLKATAPPCGSYKH